MEKWCIKISEDEQVEIVSNYITPLVLKVHTYKWNKYAKSHYAHINNGKFVNGYHEVKEGYTNLTFEEFERLILNKESNYEIF